MPVSILYLEPEDDTPQSPYSPPTLEVDDANETITLQRSKSIGNMTREDVNAEIQWAGTVFEPDLRNRGFASGLIDVLLQIIADGIIDAQNRLNSTALTEANENRV